MNSILIFDRNFWTWGPQDEGNQFIIPATDFRDRLKSLWIMNDTVWTPWETNDSKLTLSIFLEVLFNSLRKNIMGPIMCPPPPEGGTGGATNRYRPTAAFVFLNFSIYFWILSPWNGFNENIKYEIVFFDRVSSRFPIIFP